MARSFFIQSISEVIAVVQLLAAFVAESRVVIEFSSAYRAFL